MNISALDTLCEQLLHCQFPITSEERAIMRAHLERVARALQEIGRVEATGACPEAEREAIGACVAYAIPKACVSGPVADACRSVLDGYAAGLSVLDAGMLPRLVRLSDWIPSILANEARLTMAFGALRQVLFAFDRAEHRDTGRSPQSALALQAVYRFLGLTWPARA